MIDRMDRRPGVGDEPAKADSVESEAWDRMVEAFRVEAPRGSAPPWLEQKVMAEIEALPEPGLLPRLLGWLTAPRPLRVSPLAAGLVVAALAWILLVPRGPEAGDVPGADGGPGSFASTPIGTEGSVVYVQFVLEAPGARSVSVAGDFSDWQPAHELADPDGDGVWTGRVPVRPGVHAYMFLIDGTEWQTDPRADRYQDDGFGNQNAVLAVTSSD